MEMTRRDMVGVACAAAALTVTSAALGGWEPSERYPDPAVKSLDPSFNRYRLFNASIERLATGMRWCEGPAWFGDARCLIWSDIPNNALMRWDEETGAVSVYRKPSNHANGNTRDRQGRLISCEHETRRITRTEYDGSITVLMAPGPVMSGTASGTIVGSLPSCASASLSALPRSMGSDVMKKRIPPVIRFRMGMPAAES